jgi:hypothetical protein
MTPYIPDDQANWNAINNDAHWGAYAQNNSAGDMSGPPNLSQSSDISDGSSGGGAAPMKANQWLKILKTMGQRQQVPGQNPTGRFNPVQTYSGIGGVIGNLGKLFMGADGGRVQGPTPGVLGEADPEMLQHQDGSQELITSPQVRMLGTQGTDTITPLTPPPHKVSPAGKNLLKRLKMKPYRFAEGGEVEGDAEPFTAEDIGSPETPGGMDAPQALTSPETSPPSWVGSGIAPPATNPPPSTRDKLAALTLPVKQKPSILRRLAAGAIGGLAGYENATGRLRRPLDVTGVENAIKYPGYGQQMEDYTRQRTDLTNQLQQQQGAVTDQQQQAELAHTQAQTGLAQQQAATYGQQTLAQLLEKGGQVEDNGAHLTSPEGHTGSHLQVGGKTVYMPSPSEEAAAKKRADQVNWLDVPKPLQVQYGLPAKAPYQAIDAALRVMEQQGQAKAANDMRIQLAAQNEQMRRDLAADSNATRATIAAAAAGNRSDKADTTLRSTAIKTYQPAMDSAERFNVMTQNYEDAIKDHDQQAMLSLLANHLGMTMGLQKGSRLTKDIINEAKNSRPWLQGMVSKFDKDGYLSGVTLSPAQMRQMVSLGQGRFSQDISKARNEAQYIGVKDDGPQRTPSKTTINYYTALAGGDANKAKQLAAADGWSVK